MKYQVWQPACAFVFSGCAQVTRPGRERELLMPRGRLTHTSFHLVIPTFLYSKNYYSTSEKKFFKQTHGRHLNYSRRW